MKELSFQRNNCFQSKLILYSVFDELIIWFIYKYVETGKIYFSYLGHSNRTILHI